MTLPCLQFFDVIHISRTGEDRQFKFGPQIGHHKPVKDRRGAAVVCGLPATHFQNSVSFCL